jgi:hypothetical protein
MKIKITLLTIIILVTGYFPLYAALRQGSNYGLQTDTSDQGGNKSTSTNYILRQGSAGQSGAAGKSDSTNYSAGQGYIYTTNTKPATPESLAQYKANGTTSIPWPAGWTATSTEVMKMDLSDYDPGDILTPQIEVQLSTEAFTNTPSFEGASYDYSGTTLTASVTAASLEHAKTYIWQARTKDQENFYSDWKTMGGSPFDFGIDLLAPPSVEVFWATASPEPNPAYVYFTWEAVSDSGSGVAGYNLYRSTTPGSGYSKLQSLVPGTSTTDATVLPLGTDYYYVIRAEDYAGGEGINSAQASAPYIGLTREVAVTAPTGGGYTGNITDAVPGSIIKYNMYFTNRGFAVSANINIINKIPSYTEFKIGSATGEAGPSVYYSNDNGASFTYTPSGTAVDPAVTHIKWVCANISSGASRKVEFSVVIR